MKKFNLSLVTVLAMSAFAIAGGDIAPVEPVVETPYVEESTGNFYLGLGYGFLSADRETSLGALTFDQGTEDYDQILLQAGYKFNDYVALEGRYWLGLSDNAWATIGNNAIQSVGEIDSWGIYVKPMYPVGDSFNVYALLGYASTDYSITNGADGDIDGFSWGLGADYAFSESWSVFVDYTELSDDDSTNLLGNNIEDELEVWSFGVTYSF